MKKLLALALGICVSVTPALAEVATQYSPHIQDVDLAFAFENSDNLRFAAMSDIQMEETEGAVAPLVFAPVILGGARVILAGYTRHGLNQAISRGGVGVSNRAILNTMKNPTKVRHDPVRQTTSFHSKDGGVVLNQRGMVVTT